MPETRDEALNLGIRRFLKTFGVASQRAIERAAETNPAAKALKVRATLQVDGKEAYVEEAEIRLS